MIIDDNFLTQKNKEYIDQVILGDNFPYYLQLAITSKDKKEQTVLGHCVLRRKEERSTGEYWNSEHHPYFIDMFNNFTEKHNIEYNEILRCSVYLTFKSTQESCDVHNDHHFPHKQLIIYCNDCDIHAVTTLLGDETEIISPKKYRGVCFDGVPHFLTYPKQDYRIVIVYTFK
jgi:hypothetical protein|tara:strand:- start:65 stop:583 length:519 start_codon:yes stop_codon:yes gene_type:complete